MLSIVQRKMQVHREDQRRQRKDASEEAIYRKRRPENAQQNAARREPVRWKETDRKGSVWTVCVDVRHIRTHTHGAQTNTSNPKMRTLQDARRLASEKNNVYLLMSQNDSLCFRQ